MRWFGWWLRRRRRRWWWPESAMGGRRRNCRGERKAGRRRERAAVVVPIAGEDLGSWWGWDAICWWRRKVYVGSSRAEEAAGEREREERTLVGRKKNRGEAAFLAYFGPDFLLPQAIKSTSIYRRWKREILSTMEKNFSSWFRWEGSQPLAQSRHGALSNCQICSCRLPELASLGWCHVRLFASEPVKTIPRRKGMSSDQFCASFDKFGGR